jgi:DNA repair protein RadC
MARGMTIDDPARPRERMLALGGDRVGDDDLIAVLLGTGTRGRPAEALAQEILRTAGGLVALSRASPRELAQLPGMGEARALRIAAAFHLGRRAAELGRARGAVITGAEDVWERLRGRVAGVAQEVFFAIGLDVRNAVVEEVEVARGTLTSVDIHPREVFRPLIRMAAAGAVVAHNHPSGDPTPSPEDLDLTRRLREVGRVVGIPIVDHVVLGATRFTSLADFMREAF